MAKVTIELKTAYQRFDTAANRQATYTTPNTVAIVKQGDKVLAYLVPYGEDYECEGGHHIQELNQAEFDKAYSFEYIRGY